MIDIDEIAEHAASRFTFRNATFEDLDSITTIAIAGWEFDDQWSYRFPYRKEYPDDHWHYTRQRYIQYLNSVEEEHTWIQIVETSGSDKRVLGFAIWDLPGSLVKKAETRAALPAIVIDHSVRRDVDLKRYDAYRAASVDYKKEVLEERYGKNQLNLMTIVVHPDYFRRGAGTMLIRNGVDIARQQKVPITVYASPMGVPMYRKFGFKEISMIHVQVPGDPESVDFPAMVLEL